MEISTRLGMLFLIGGAADKCVAEFVNLAGGTSAHVLVIPFASGEPVEAARDLKAELAGLGVKRVDIAVAGEPLSIANGTTAVYMTGGDQSRLAALLSKGDRARLRRFLRRGGLIAGTSAGAAAAGCHMVTGGMSDGVLKEGALTSGRGLSLVGGAIFDTHFAQRNRYNRLIAATWQYPRLTGVGLDEDTAVLIDGAGRATVYGAGRVWFYSAPAGAKSRHGSLAEAKKKTVVTALAAGESFTLHKQ